MSSKDAVVRIFISSPGDVHEEREQARRVVENLQRRYTDIKLETILWENLPLPATASFQQSIDYLLTKEPIDIAIFILWSRLGTPLGPPTARPDGSIYRSGTEREFELMLSAYEQSGEKKRPIILAYSREDKVAFAERLASTPKDQWAGMISQSKLADEFIQEHFHDEQGRNRRAYYTYPKPPTFAQRLHEHLLFQLDEMFSVDVGPRWQDEPYRGLQSFDVQHGPIFKGREKETCEVLERLQDRSQAGCASVVIVGASGSGKSSLARAGVAATLQQQVFDTSVKEWRIVTFTPGRGSADLLARLMRAIAEALPEQNASPQTLDKIAAALAGETAENAVESAVQIGVVPMFERAAEQAQGVVRLLLIVDQLEELWTDQRFEASHNRFLSALRALACSGFVSVVTTLRSDFYREAQQSDAFLALKEGRGHFDLLPPGPEVLHRLIEEPARLAGLRFEHDSKTGRMLDQEIAKAAAQGHVALPLLQYALSELYQKRDSSRNLLTLEAYDELGGLEGAIGRRAEKIFSDLPAEVRASLPDVVRQLAVVREGSDEGFCAARAEMGHVASTPQRRELIHAFVDARLLVVDQTGAGAAVGFAHEALLAHWPRLKQLLEEDREFLRVRHRIQAAAHRWKEENRVSDYLLPSGKPLVEAADLLKRYRGDLDHESIEFVTRSIAWNESARNLRRGIVAAASLAFLLVCAISSIVFYFQKKNADVLRTKAEEGEEFARKNLVFARLLAGHSWEVGDIEYARRYLEETPPDERDWEWRYLRRLCDGNQLTIPTEHPSSVVQWSPDGASLLAAWTANKTASPTDENAQLPEVRLSPLIGQTPKQGGIDVWESATGRSLMGLRELNGAIHTAAFLAKPNDAQQAGPLVLSVSEDGSPLLKGSGKTSTYHVEIRKEGVTEPVRTLDLSGHFISVGHEGHVATATNQSSGQKTGSLAKRLIDGLDLASSSVRFAFGNVTTDDHDMANFEVPVAAVTSLLLHPSGNQLISTHQDGILRFWDTEQRKEVGTLPMKGEGFELAAISQDGRVMALSGSVERQRQPIVEIWNNETKERICTIPMNASLNKMAFDALGRQLAAGYLDQTVRVWDARTGEEVRVYRGHMDQVIDVAFHPRESILASSSRDKTVKLWDLSVVDQRATALKVPGAQVRQLALPDAGSLLALVREDRAVEVWNTTTGTRERELPSGGFAAMSPSGNVLAVGETNDLVLYLLDGKKQNAIRGQGHDADVRAASFSRDGERVVSVDERGKWIVWRVSDGEKLMELPQLAGAASWVFGAKFSPDGRYLLGHHDAINALMVWDTANSQTKPGYESYDLPDTLLACGMSEDGQRIVALSGWGLDEPALVSVWERGKKEPIFQHRVSGGFVHGAAVSHNGKRLFTAIGGRGVLVWDVDSGQVTLSLTNHGQDARALVLSANGDRLAGIYGTSETVLIWDATPLPEAAP